MLTTDQKGSIAEWAIALAAARLEIDVYKPMNDGTRCDLIFDLGGELWRIQCKWATRNGGVVTVPCLSCRRNAGGFVRRTYSPADIDAFAAYCDELQTSYFLPIADFEGRQAIQLRLSDPKNGQRAGINWARSYEFGATLGVPGAVAQLGERRHGMAEARGSSPLGSTSPAPAQTVGAHEFRERFGWYMERAAAGEEIAITRHGKPTVRLVAAA